MHLHDDSDKHLQPMRPVQMDEPRVSAKFVMRRRGTPVRGPSKRLRRPELPSPEAGIVDDSPMIAMCYEAHLSMQKMLAAFAELRGDDVQTQSVDEARVEPC
jgi:hypothetical protein